jgi:CheY-like chemotaxis protein
MDRRCRIMVIDDDIDDQLILKDYFSEAGIPEHDVSYFANGRSGIEYLVSAERGTLPDVIVLDMNMPIMNGVQTLLHLKREPVLRKIPVIIYSTSDNDQEKRKGLSLGAAEYLVKPMSYTDGLNMVRRIVEFLK